MSREVSMVPVPVGNSVFPLPFPDTMALVPGMVLGALGASGLLGSNNNSSMIEDVTRLDSRIDGMHREQSEYNTRMAGLVSGQVQQLQTLSSRNDELFTRTDRLRDQFGEANLQLGRVQSDTSSLQMNNNRIDSQLQLFQSDQNNLNLAVAERTARVEEQHQMVSKQQGMFNDGILSRAVALEKKLGNTSTQMEVVCARTDCLQRGQDELNLNLTQTNQRIDQFNIDHDQKYQQLAASAVRNEEGLSSLRDSQRMVNEKFMNFTDVFTEKQQAVDSKLELMNHRADTLQDSQTKIGDELRQQRLINENRQLVVTQSTQSLAERSARVEEKQNCFMSEQKSQNDQFLNRTENVLQKVGETSKKVDFVNISVNNLQTAQQKTELELKDKDKQWHETAKKIVVVEHSTRNLRDEQKEIKDQLKALLTLVTDIAARMNMVENRLDTLQSDYHRVSEMCIKLKANKK